MLFLNVEMESLSITSQVWSMIVFWHFFFFFLSSCCKNCVPMLLIKTSTMLVKCCPRPPLLCFVGGLLLLNTTTATALLFSCCHFPLPDVSANVRKSCQRCGSVYSFLRRCRARPRVHVRAHGAARRGRGRPGECIRLRPMFWLLYGVFFRSAVYSVVPLLQCVQTDPKYMAILDKKKKQDLFGVGCR